MDARNIEKETLTNSAYRKVLYTKDCQMVLMCLKKGEIIPAEIHSDLAQFIRVESGTGVAQIDRTKTRLRDGSSIIIPAGANHEIRQTGDQDLKLYTIYMPVAPVKHFEHKHGLRQMRQPHL